MEHTPYILTTDPQRVGTLLSVNVGLPKDVAWQGKTVFTGVFKDARERSAPGAQAQRRR